MPTLRDKLECMTRYLRCPGLPEKNHECGKRFGALEYVEFDHIHRRSSGGPDTADNLRPLCKDCHKLKTFGAGATTAGSDIHMEAKARRIGGETGRNKRKRAIPNRGFQKPADGYRWRWT